MRHRPRIRDALEQFRAVEKLQPNDPSAHFQLAQVLAQVDQVDESIREQQAGLTLSGTNADDWNFLGELYVRAETNGCGAQGV